MPSEQEPPWGQCEEPSRVSRVGKPEQAPRIPRQGPCITCPVVLGNVAVLLQDLLHAAERDGCQVPRVLQLEEPLQVASRLASSQIDAFAVFGIKPTPK